MKKRKRKKSQLDHFNRGSGPTREISIIQRFAMKFSHICMDPLPKKITCQPLMIRAAESSPFRCHLYRVKLGTGFTRTSELTSFFPFFFFFAYRLPSFITVNPYRFFSAHHSL